MSVSWTKAQDIIRGFPGTEEASAYGREGFKVGKKFFCAFNEKENALAIRVSMDERELLMQTAPEIYYVTDHYRPYPSMLVSLKRISERELRLLIERRWRERAPAKLVKAFDEASSGSSARDRPKPPRRKTVSKPGSKGGRKGSRMTPDAFRRLALSFPEATEGGHMGHADFRVGGKIFATLGYPDARYAVVLLTRDEQELFVEEAPEAFTPAKGGWGLKGSTQVELKAAKPAITRSALLAAWRRRAPKRPRDEPGRKARS